MKTRDISGKRTLLILLLATLLLVLAVFRPLGKALFLAAVLAMVLWPAHVWLTRRFRGRSSLSAGILVGAVVVFTIGPLVALSAFVVTETRDAVRFVSTTMRSEGTRGLLAKLPDPVERRVASAIEAIPGETEDVTQAVEDRVSKAGGSAAAAVGKAVSATGSLLFQGTMMVLALFFILTNKGALVKWLDEASPLRDGQTTELFNEFLRVCKTVIVSTAATALVQALVALVGYFIARVPHPLFFFALTFIIAFIPAAGAASVCLVAAAIKLATGHPWAALFLAVYAILVVGLVDNVVKPLLMKGGVGMHGAIVFFALLGGLAAFGAMGLLIGPLAVALFLTMLRMYQRDYAADPSDREAMRRQNVGEPPSADDAPAPAPAPAPPPEPVKT